MFASILRENISNDFSKFRIIKNLLIVSLSFLFMYSGDSGLLMLQTTMNKEVGTATLATNFATFGITSLLFSSFLVKKLGSKNAQFLGALLIIPFFVSNFYPTWITMLPSAVLRGIGNSLLWAAQCTYFNELSVFFCKISENRRNLKNKSKIIQTYNDTNNRKEIMTSQPEQKINELSAIDLINKTDTSISDRNSTIYHADTSSLRLTSYISKKDDVSESTLFSKENNAETKIETNIKNFNKPGFSKERKHVSNEKNEEVFPGIIFEKINEVQETVKCQARVDSIKALFFGIHGLAFHSATIWGNLISYYILETGAKEDNLTLNHNCGANFCAANHQYLNNTIEEVPENTRYLLTGVCLACAIVAPLLILLFLDQIAKKTEIVKLSWDQVSATIKYTKKKDQLLLIPFTVITSLCRGFYLADFTKSYIACSWSISYIGLITVIYGLTSSFSSLFSGVMIKYVGRRNVLTLCQIITIADFVFLFFWIPDAHQPYMFYVQGGIFGMIFGIMHSQTQALYGIFFEGEEATAFSSSNLYSSIGWTLPFIYNDFLCVSVKVYIVLAFSGTGLLGYLLAERRYSLRNKQTYSTQ